MPSTLNYFNHNSKKYLSHNSGSMLFIIMQGIQKGHYILNRHHRNHNFVYKLLNINLILNFIFSIQYLVCIVLLFSIHSDMFRKKIKQNRKKKRKKTGRKIHIYLCKVQVELIKECYLSRKIAESPTGNLTRRWGSILMRSSC